MVFCRFLPLPVLLSAGLAGVGAMDLHEQRMMEAPSLLRGGASSDEIKVVTVPVDVLHSAQFSSLLDAYLEDTALERALGECRLWIDVGRFRGKQTTTDPLPPAPDATEKGELKEGASSPKHKPMASAEEEPCTSLNKQFPAPDATEKGELKEGVSSPKHKPMASAEEEPCTSLNKQFGWSVKTRSGPFEDPFSFAVCTEAPWFAEVEVVKVEEADETGELGPGHLLLHVKYNPPLPTEAPWFAEVEVVKVEDADETGELGPGHLLLHVKYNPPLPAAFPSKMPSKIPLAPSQIMTPSVDDSVGPPRPGDKATVLCLEVGKPLLFSSQVENDTAYLDAFVASEGDSYKCKVLVLLVALALVLPEFLPGPWSVQVDVELYADVSRPMGVGARLRVRDNVAVTLPPSRLLPFPTEGLRPEEWVLLELADLHSQQQRQSGETDGQETDELDRLELWDKVQREGALEAFATRQCRLRRGEKFGDPVQLDCLPDLKAQTGKELVTNGLEIVRRGVIGLALTLISTMGVNAAFHSLIRSNDSFAQRMEKAATELSLFNLKREWKLEAPLEAWKNPDAEDKIMEIARKGWTPQQTELLDEIASEMLQLYAQGAKDRRKHKTEGKIKFEESDDKLVIRVPVSNLSYRRRHILGVLFEKELELVFTFVDRGGQFHPFHKISTAQGGTAAVDEQKGILETTGGTQPSQGITAKPVGETALEAAQAGDKGPRA
ncbi:LOW QUALITY PROTEIN: uncharacterized protein EMH_0043810 [Eimeria mitis]|uniref:Uncharacterized protein n=1 Tax=Eimeria mitis TaxID=44415 RepID=U6JXJ5_9EIME|nr:LOW QUALITY PROTEIN: uncharacterized protein EMH_0043810 [Eimeria mitis]CDJ28772.1 hypothetical protein, conserved [Eimeria mitis]